MNQGIEKAAKYLDIRLDTGFKLVFCHPEVLIPFLNTFLDLVGDQRITEVVYRDKEHIPLSRYFRKAFFDLYCTTANGEHLIIEMQRDRQLTFIERCLYYMSHVIVNQAPQKLVYKWWQRIIVKPKKEEKPWTFELAPVYVVGILDFAMFPGDGRFVRRALLMDPDSGEVITKKIQLLFIELAKFDKTVEQLETEKDEWMFYMKYMHSLDIDPESVTNEGVRQMLHYSLIANQPPEVMTTYLAERNQVWSMNATLDAKFEEGREEGRTKEKLETARLMKAEGESVEKIIHYTGLSKEQISQL